MVFMGIIPKSLNLACLRGLDRRQQLVALTEAKPLQNPPVFTDVHEIYEWFSNFVDSETFKVPFLFCPGKREGMREYPFIVESLPPCDVI